MPGFRYWIILSLGFVLTACPGKLPDLELRLLEPPSAIIEAQQNRSLVVRVQVVRNNGFSGPVELSVEGDKLGTASNQIGHTLSALDAEGKATITFETRQTDPGIYNLTVKAAAPSVNASLKPQLVIFKERLVVSATPDTVIQNDTPEPASVALSARLASGVSGAIKWSLEGQSPGSLSGNSGENINYIPPTGCVATARNAEVKATLEGGSNPGLSERNTITLAPSNRGTIKITVGNIPAGLQPEIQVGGKPLPGNSATLTLDAGIQPVTGKGLEEAGKWVDGYLNLPVAGIEVKGCTNPDLTLNYLKRGRKIWLAGAGGLRRLPDNANLIETANPSSTLFKAPSAAVVDKAGNLYVANQDNGSLTRFSAAALQTANALSQYTLTSSGINEPTGLALDASGNLWVANHGSNTLVRFDRTALEPLGNVASLSPKPTLVIKGEGEVLRGLWGMAFNAAGDLFVSLFDQEELVRIPAAKLSGTSPITLKESDVFRVENLTGPKGLAFDGSGRLWVAEYVGGALIGVGNAFNQPLEAIRRDLSVTLLGKLNPNTPNEQPIQKFLNLAFDREGQIWAVNEAGMLMRFKSETTSGVYTQSPGTTAFPAFTQPDSLGALALDVHPAGLPLNGRP